MKIVGLSISSSKPVQDYTKSFRIILTEIKFISLKTQDKMH